MPLPSCCHGNWSFLPRPPSISCGRIPDAARGAVLTRSTQGPKWDMQMPTAVTQLKGCDVVLPCNFTHPNINYTGTIRVLWEPHFHCWVANDSNANGNCSKEPGPNSRYSLAGDPRQHNLSLRVARLSFEDNGLYRCRVELDIRGQSWTHPSPLNLTVEAAPSILNLSLLEGPEPGPARAVCTAEGRPLPNITWWGPGNTPESPSPLKAQAPFQSAVEITLRRNGTYTCRANNKWGQAERSLTVGSDHFPLLAALLPAVLLLLVLLVLALVLCQRRKGRCQSSQRDSAAHASPTSDRPHAGICTYTELSTVRVTGADAGAAPKPQAWLPPTPGEDITYAELVF